MNSNEKLPDRFPYNDPEMLEWMIEHDVLDDILEFEQDVLDDKSYN